ncbi:N-acetylmuramoyl-L-alanine amidase [Sinorhizobium meliloti]|nr:N-acetylmuramoyl-L-alanine amidase [Sinorhizobium meliloti]
MRPLNTIAVHCTATPEGKEYIVDTIRGWHKQFGWSDIGYHFIVHLDGRVSTGRPLDKVGAHVAGHNTGSIGISYIGGCAADGRTAKDTRTAAQKASLRKLIGDLIKQYPTIRIVKGHRDFSPDTNGDGKITAREWLKACPCFDAIPEYADLIEKAA